MASKFVGGEEKVVRAIDAVNLTTGAGPGPWVDLEEAEIYEFEAAVAVLNADTLDVWIETDLGIVDDVQQVAVAGEFVQWATTGTKTIKIPLGSVAGGRRVRAAWLVAGGSEAGTLAVTARESRSGLA